MSLIIKHSVNLEIVEQNYANFKDGKRLEPNKLSH